MESREFSIALISICDRFCKSYIQNCSFKILVFRSADDPQVASTWKRAYGGGDTAATVKDPDTAAAMDRLGKMEWLFALGNHDYRYVYAELLLFFFQSSLRSLQMQRAPAWVST